MLLLAVYPRIPARLDPSCSSFTSFTSSNSFGSSALSHRYDLTPVSSMISALFSHLSVPGSPATRLESSAHTHFPLTTEGVGGGEKFRRNGCGLCLQPANINACGLYLQPANNRGAGSTRRGYLGRRVAHAPLLPGKDLSVLTPFKMNTSKTTLLQPL